MNFDWAFFVDQLTSPNGAYIRALWTTLYMAVIAQLLGIALGAIVAAGRLSKMGFLSFLAFLYTWVIRGIPVIVFMVLLYTGVAAAGIFRFEDITIGSFTLRASVQAAIAALSIREGAYMSEVIRNGVQSVERGQLDAARALGMPWWTVLGRVVMPQALRVIIPPLGNNFNIMLKTTSLASVIGVQELFLVTRSISAATFKVFEMFTIVALNYLLLTTIWAVIQVLIEMRLNRHEADTSAKPWWKRVAEFLSGTGTPNTPGAV